ncbi:hypothetical protein HanXRQr2_Chr04g0156551 [Helianthus annuus]|uniref:Uncharacterized protein n=1 Tax=Helianthus annuus TaxID=4232 RepID=A0A9K3J6N0_HELAN|nr:hypothetical protein HanXRQr2_Chr04g0156551 [Helianthus annuus]KAJ0587912.1 hypothetical protein HanIR_Chr04g0168601 [Helianthus annuus]KAJ0756997.1 hypothetical protein HanLR1_Chr04g0133491 [Helianthus annuus]KAJ0760733.1 hypothetical protein HanOQP8_Chr04g0141371 [Helianthus annuus]KAJ0930548.1 hypothetical protein HanPSC8_Chr04g0150591 [Helianthus annuus]
MMCIAVLNSSGRLFLLEEICFSVLERVFVDSCDLRGICVFVMNCLTFDPLSLFFSCLSLLKSD